MDATLLMTILQVVNNPHSHETRRQMMEDASLLESFVQYTGLGSPLTQDNLDLIMGALDVVRPGLIGGRPLSDEMRDNLKI